MSINGRHLYEFGDFSFDADEKILLNGGKRVPLTPKSLDLLRVLIENHGRIVEKETLLAEVWAGSFVEESNLTFTISLLRKALCDNSKSSRLIETVPKRGYRFVAETKEIFASNTLKNDLAQKPQESFQTTDIRLAESPAVSSPKAKNFLVPIVAFGVLLIGSVIAVSWYVRGKNPESNAPILSAPFALEKISTSGKVFSVAVSPDGKTAIYTTRSGERQSLWLRQLDSANNVEIIPPSNAHYYNLFFSPDGNFIYFSRKPKDKDGQTDLYRISIFGGVPVKIVSEAQGWLSVSPDGEKISFTRCYYRDDEFCSLWIADARDGTNERKLASRPRPVRIGDSNFSPDGKSVVFAVGQSENQSSEFGLAEINLETGAERAFTAEKFFNIRNLVWLPDASGLLVTASRIPNKNFRVWQVSAATGEATPLTKDSESYAVLSLDRAATVLAATQIKEDFHLRLFNVENPSAANKDLTSASSATFAPNGKIIFSSPMSGNDEIWSMDADGGEQRQLTNNAADEFLPIVSPDGNSIFFTSNRTGEMHVWRMNADGGNQTQITHKDGGMPLFISPDGKWIYYSHNLNRTLWRVSTEDDGEQLVLNKAKSYFAFSPDGSLVAFEEKQGEEKFIVVASIAVKQTIKPIKYAAPQGTIFNIIWTQDGKSLIYVLADGEYENYTLWVQPLDEQMPPRQIADLGSEEVASLTPAPDGKNFLLVQGDWRHDAVLLKGLK